MKRLIALSALLASPTPAIAQDCEALRLDLPEEIAFAVRPYVVCGLISTGIFSQASHGGFSIENCANLRESAAVMADQELTRSITDADQRAAYVTDILERADEFIRLARTNEWAIDPETQLPTCTNDVSETDNAEN